MPEIISRGRNPKAGWIYGAYIRHETRQRCLMGNDKLKPEEIEHYIARDGFADWNMPRNIELVPVDPETVGVNTLATDKKKKYIFSGDVIAFTDCAGKLNCGYVRYGEPVRYTRNRKERDGFEPAFYVQWKHENSGLRRDLSYWAPQCEIIGNIHDNPEMMGLSKEKEAGANV